MAAMPLEGVRILDFTWVVAGPVATRILGDHGAQVVKVERKNPPPLGNRKLGLQCDLHRSKLSVALNMQHPRGVRLWSVSIPAKFCATSSRWLQKRSRCSPPKE